MRGNLKRDEQTDLKGVLLCQRRQFEHPLSHRLSLRETAQYDSHAGSDDDQGLRKRSQEPKIDRSMGNRLSPHDYVTRDIYTISEASSSGTSLGSRGGAN